jgi:hypothetical protein
MAEQFSNLAITVLLGGINNVQTSLVVDDATGFPTTGDFRIVVDRELMLVTAVSGTTFTVTRGIESTTAATHNDGAKVAHVLTVASLTKAIEQTTGVVANAEPSFILSSTGDTRGSYAVDMQVASATTSDKVASGDYASISGGKDNKAAATYGVIGGGLGNTVTQPLSMLAGTTSGCAVVAGGASNQATGHFAVVGGGRDNSTSGTDSVIIGGSTNTAVGNGAVILGGNNNAAGGAYGVAMGLYASAYHKNYFVESNYAFSLEQGSCNRGRISLAAETTNATLTTTSCDHTTASSFKVPTGKTILFRLSIFAVDTNGGTSVWDEIKGVCQNLSGTTSVLGGYVKELEHNQQRNVGDEIPAQFYDSSSAALKVSVTTSGDELRVNVKGKAATKYRWHCSCVFSELSKPTAGY